MVWYSHLFQNFPQFIVIYIVKGFGIVNKAEIDIFLELSSFFNDLALKSKHPLTGLIFTVTLLTWNFCLSVKFRNLKVSVIFFKAFYR